MPPAILNPLKKRCASNFINVGCIAQQMEADRDQGEEYAYEAGPEEQGATTCGALFCLRAHRQMYVWSLSLVH